MTKSTDSVQVSRTKCPRKDVSRADFDKIALHPLASKLVRALNSQRKLVTEEWSARAAEHVLNGTVFDAVREPSGKCLIFAPLEQWSMLRHLSMTQVSKIRIRDCSSFSKEDVATSIETQALVRLACLPHDDSLGPQLMQLLTVVPLETAQAVTGLPRISIRAIGTALGRTWSQLTHLPLKQLEPVRKRYFTREGILERKLKLHALESQKAVSSRAPTY